MLYPFQMSKHNILNVSFYIIKYYKILLALLLVKVIMQEYLKYKI